MAQFTDLAEVRLAAFREYLGNLTLTDAAREDFWIVWQAAWNQATIWSSDATLTTIEERIKTE